MVLSKAPTPRPEFALSADWLRYAVRTFKAQLGRQTYPDGSHTEMSNHYQRVTTTEAQHFVTVLQAGGRGPILGGSRARLERRVWILRRHRIQSFRRTEPLIRLVVSLWR